jgi:hypothetical protein
VFGFLDSNQKIKEFNGYKVFVPDEILNSNNCFIIISSRFFANEISQICENAGLKENEDFWSPISGELIDY